MNIVVIGLGSMGKRRLRLLKKYIKLNNCVEWLLAGVDTREDRRSECEREYGIETFGSIQQACEQRSFDCAVVSTAPLTHAGIIEECLKANMHVFTELNLVDNGYDQNLKWAKEHNRILFLSSTFLYRKEIQYIKKQVSEKAFRGMYRYHIGQYLPTWHPWENYKEFFVENKATNGCREIFAIELPWLVDCFGKVTKIYSTHRKCSQLNIEYDDSYQVVVEHENGIVGTLTVDVVTPLTERKFEMFQENFYVKWEGTPDSLQIYDKSSDMLNAVLLYEQAEHEAGYNQFVVENAYYDELKEFIDVINMNEVPKYSFEKDKEILKLIDRIEE